MTGEIEAVSLYGDGNCTWAWHEFPCSCWPCPRKRVGCVSTAFDGFRNLSTEVFRRPENLCNSKNFDNPQYDFRRFEKSQMPSTNFIFHR